MGCLDKEYWEMDLFATLEEMKEEVQAHMDITEDLTNKARGNNKAYLTAVNGTHSMLFLTFKVMHPSGYTLSAPDNRVPPLRQQGSTTVTVEMFSRSLQQFSPSTFLQGAEVVARLLITVPQFPFVFDRLSDSVTVFLSLSPNPLNRVLRKTPRCCVLLEICLWPSVKN